MIPPSRPTDDEPQPTRTPGDVIDQATDGGQSHTPGVGPWDGPPPTGDHYDPDLLAQGDRRNVMDHYRYWTREAIVADLDTTRSDFHIAIENTGHDFNIGSVVRTANAFNTAGVHIVGRRRWNRRGAMVTDRYLHVTYHQDATDLIAWAHETNHTLIGVDNHPGAKPLPTTPLPQRSILILGEEGPGISDELWQACHTRVAIPQVGSTRSINLGAAAAIVMYHWMCQHHATFA